MSISTECVKLPSIKKSGIGERFRSWLSIEPLSRQFWISFTAAFLFDLGVGLIFFCSICFY